MIEVTMPDEEEKPEPTEHPNAPKKTDAPKEMAGWTPREAARYGIWSSNHSGDGVRRRYPYSKM